MDHQPRTIWPFRFKTKVKWALGSYMLFFFLGVESARPLAAVLFSAKKRLRMVSCLHKLGTLLDLSACSCTLKLGTLLDLCAPLLNQNHGTLLYLCTGTPPLAKMAKFRCPLFRKIRPFWSSLKMAILTFSSSPLSLQVWAS